MADTTTKARVIIQHFGKRFTPKLLPSVFFIACVPLFCALGVWQLHRGHFKEEVLANYAKRQHAQPRSISDINNPKAQEFYPITVQGTLDEQHNLLVENKFYQHRLGYVVLTPLMLSDGSVVLIDRGWVPQAQAKQLSKSKNPVTLTGIIHIPATTIFQIGEIPAQSNWPKPLQNLSWREINRVNPGWTLHPFVITLNASSPLSYTPIYQPSIMKPAKHFGYAVQWFAMALAVSIIFVALGFKKQ